MARVLEYLDQALAEAEAAAHWYAERSQTAAVRFSLELEAAETAILERPDSWPAADAGTRRFLLHRFPFSVVYRVEESRVLIVAVAHGRRRPGYWRGRVAAVAEPWREIDAHPEDAQKVLRRACGSTRWVDRMMARRPFGSDAALRAAAREEWLALSEQDWLEAFSHHPRIGDRASLAVRFPATHDLSAKEQSGVGAAQEDVLTALADANDAYFQRFGFIFIVCATGKSAEEMLKLLRDRLPNDRATELRIAAEEQARITALRLG